MMLPTGVVILGSGQRADPIKIGPDLIPLEHAEWFSHYLRQRYLIFRGQVYYVSSDLMLGDKERHLYLHPTPYFTPPDPEVSSLLVPYTIFRD